MTDLAPHVDEHNADELDNAGYEIFIGALSVLSIVNLALALFIRDDDLSTVLLWINVLLSVVFMLDFVYRLASADSKSQYFLHEYGWADLLASLPFEQVKILRVFRVARVWRLFRRFGARNIGRSVLHERAESALFTLLLLGVFVLEFGSIGILALEQDHTDADILTASDALWFVIVTISTVGYGDLTPITSGGRVLGAVIIVIGVGIFGTFTGYLANLFLAPRRRDPGEPVGDAQRRVDQLRAMVTEQQAAIDELERLLQTRR